MGGLILIFPDEARGDDYTACHYGKPEDEPEIKSRDSGDEMGICLGAVNKHCARSGAQNQGEKKNHRKKLAKRFRFLWMIAIHSKRMLAGNYLDIKHFFLFILKLGRGFPRYHRQEAIG